MYFTPPRFTGEEKQDLGVVMEKKDTEWLIGKTKRQCEFLWQHVNIIDR